MDSEQTGGHAGHSAFDAVISARLASASKWTYRWSISTFSFLREKWTQESVRDCPVTWLGSSTRRPPTGFSNLGTCPGGRWDVCPAQEKQEPMSLQVGGFTVQFCSAHRRQAQELCWVGRSPRAQGPARPSLGHPREAPCHLCAGKRWEDSCPGKQRPWAIPLRPSPAPWSQGAQAPLPLSARRSSGPPAKPTSSLFSRGLWAKNDYYIF